MSRPPCRRGWAWVVASPVMICALLAVLSAAPIRSRWGSAGLQAMLLALLVVAGAAVLAVLPVLRHMPAARGVERLKLAFQAAGLRFMAGLAAAVAVAWLLPVQRRVFLVCFALGYVAASLAETVALVLWMKRSGNTACSSTAWPPETR